MLLFSSSRQIYIFFFLVKQAVKYLTKQYAPAPVGINVVATVNSEPQNGDTVHDEQT